MIKVENVTKEYRTDGTVTKALDGVSFTVEKGEFVAIIGPSGSGKSTLMHILGALDVPTSGKYFLNDVDVGHMSDDELAEIRNKELGFIFQAYNLLPRVSALRNVKIPMIYAGLPKKTRDAKAVQLMELVGLKDKLANNPNQLSGGQKQRVAIARALAMEPSLLLADEPTGNLPSNQSDEIMTIFKDLNQKGHTIIVITHNDHIAHQTKRVISLVDGKITKDKLN
jgi:putative ABC transport system ATP-binding protein